MLDETKKKGKYIRWFIGIVEVDDSGNIDVSPAYVRDDSLYLRRCKKTMLMFRRL